MYIFAYVCLLVALLFSIGAGGMALLRLWQGRPGQATLTGACAHVVGGARHSPAWSFLAGLSP